MPQAKTADRRTVSDSATWPVIWRVVLPACGIYGHDAVLLETEDEATARHHYRGSRQGGWPCRLERVACGPLPNDFEDRRAKWLAASKAPVSQAPDIFGAWTTR